MVFRARDRLRRECAAGAPDVADPVASESLRNPQADEAKAKLDALVKRADQALLDDHRLDYELPFVKKSVAQPETVEKLLDACRAGHRPSCWIAAEIAPRDDQARLYELVASNCRNGDQLSCRALPEQLDVKEPAYTDLPGTLGRVTCAELDVCDVDGLKRECAAGFGRSCQALDVHLDEKERARLAVFSTKSFKEDCAAGITYGCNAIYDVPGEEQFELYQAECRLERWTCGLLRESYDKLKPQRRPRRARAELYVRPESQDVRRAW